MRLLISVAILVVSGCSGAESHTQPPDSTARAKGDIGTVRAPNDSRIETELDYTIEDSNSTPGIKRSLTIRLSRKASEDALGELALTLKNLDSNEYQRTFIHYYLPGMTVGEGAWARSDYNPELQIQIFGMSIDDDEAIDREDSTWTAPLSYMIAWLTVVVD